MHPDIKSFWENLGYTIKYEGCTVYSFDIIVDSKLNDIVSYNIITKDYKDKRIYLWLDRKYYYEEEILRLIKLKAFI